MIINDGYKYYNLFFIQYLLLCLSIINAKSNFLSFQETFSNEYKNLYDFIANNGGYINPKMVPNEKDQTNRFITTNSKISKDEQLLFIPKKILISRYNLDIYPICKEVYGFDEDRDFDCIVYFMTIDKFNSSSFFKPYYDYLPKINFEDFIISLDQEEIKTLDRSGITEGIKYAYHFLNKTFEPAEPFFKKYSKKYNIDYQKILNEFKINFYMVGTRNFGRPDNFLDVSTMVPYLDLLNHSDKPKTHWFFDEKKGGYILIAAKDIEKNEELTDSYGKYSNYLLYKVYGFAIPGNIYNETFYVKGQNFRLSICLDDIKRSVNNIFYNFVKNDENEVEKARDKILQILRDELNYYLSIKINRFSINVIIKDRIKAINIYINEVEKYQYKN